MAEVKTEMILIFVIFNVVGFVEPQNSQSMPQCVQKLMESDNYMTWGFSAYCISKYRGIFNELTSLPQRIANEVMQNYRGDLDVTAEVVSRTFKEVKNLYCSKDGREALQCQTDNLNRECPELQSYFASYQGRMDNLLSTGAASSSLMMILDSAKGIEACAGASGGSGRSGRSGGSGVEPRAMVNVSVIILLALTVFSIVYQY